MYSQLICPFVYAPFAANFKTICVRNEVYDLQCEGEDHASRIREEFCEATISKDKLCVWPLSNGDFERTSGKVFDPLD